MKDKSGFDLKKTKKCECGRCGCEYCSEVKPEFTPDHKLEFMSEKPCPKCGEQRPERVWV